MISATGWSIMEEMCVRQGRSHIVTGAALLIYARRGYKEMNPENLQEDKKVRRRLWQIL